MKQKWYNKVTNQSALINAIPNVGLVAISIITVLITLNISKSQIFQNQKNFDKQMQKDSLLNVQQDSITKQRTALTKLQLEVLNKQFENDSINNYKKLLIAKEEFKLNNKNKAESDLMNQENLSVNGVSFLTYDTKYQDGFLDSIYGFHPNIIYQTQNNNVNNEFRLLYRLVIHNLNSDSLLLDLPILQTLSDANNYIKKSGFNSKFEILKEFTIVCDLINSTKFPIKVLESSKDRMRWVGKGYTFEAPKTVATGNSLIIYPGSKAGFTFSFFANVDTQFDTPFIISMEIEYVTVFGQKRKTLKAHFDPVGKIFVLFD